MVDVGDTVEEGDALVILESMKMEMPIEAEDRGVVREIRCGEGQPVSEDEILMVLDPHDLRTGRPGQRRLSQAAAAADAVRGFLAGL